MTDLGSSIIEATFQAATLTIQSLDEPILAFCALEVSECNGALVAVQEPLVTLDAGIILYEASNWAIQAPLRA